MPVYNTPCAYLREAIDSILTQTFADFEFIIINDGSTDASVAQTVKSYADPRIVYIEQQANTGQVGAMNNGIRAANGEYIARMDSDDISLPERFAKQVAFLDTHPDISLCSSCYQRFGDSNKIIIHPENIQLIDMLRGCYIAHPIVMWRRADFMKYNLFYNDDYPLAEDYELWSRAMRILKFYNLQEILFKYRWHNQNISRKKGEIQRANARRIKQNILDFLTTDKEFQKDLFYLAKGKKWYGIPLIKVKKSIGKTKAYLFGIIPIYSKNTNTL
ncbi:glycosyltransferase family 3 [Candidatus Symbiothrix dinenymphae]|nr:glycosyltransferase family 3 [Candidatus Symbiothrix dinenymphae]